MPREGGVKYVRRLQCCEPLYMARRPDVFSDMRPLGCSRRTLVAFGIVVISGLFVAGNFVGALSTSRGSTSGLSAALPAGDYISFTCLHSSISSGGSYLCNDQTGNTFDLCNSSVCTYSLTGTADNGYIFANWTSTGDAFFGTSGSGCSSSQFSTSNPVVLCMTVPNTVSRYSGSVTTHVV